MKKVVLAIIVVAICGMPALAAVDFNDYFIDKTLRIDFYMTGDFDEEYISTDQMYEYGSWAGNPKRTVFPFNLGDTYVKVYSAANNELIYSKGFGTIFGEYRTTNPGRNNIKKTYLESILMPYPKAPVIFTVSNRDRKNVLHEIYREKIYPTDVNIIKDKPRKDDLVYESLKNGNPHEKVDFVFVAEGYTAGEYEKFKKDVDRFRDVLLSAEPYKSNKDKFNIYGAFRASAESGVDIPQKGIFKNTALSASYNALALDRYLLVDDLKTMRDVACNAPWEYIIVLTNSSQYGGGGIYNNYTIFTADNGNSSNTILMHEFGHGFSGLADEYFDATVSYEEFFEPGVEPLEANITALLDPCNVKWKHLLTPGIPVPTPWGKTEREALQAEQRANTKKMNDEIAALQKEGGNDEKIAQVRQSYQDKNSKIRQEISRIQKENQQKWAGKVGVFEGAGYSSKGLYRSEITVDFFNARDFNYGPVSREWIKKFIDFYAD